MAAIIGFALGAVYLSLVSYQQIDGYLFPGNELKVPVVSAAIPNTDIGVDVSLPGVSTNAPEPWRPEDRLNILVLGLDRRPGEPEDASYRADTMFVASIDRHAGRIQFLAIPRDTYADIPYGDVPGVWAQNKINAAYSYGQFYKYPGGGAAACVAAVEKNFSIDIHHHVVIDWVGFVELIDSIGGIEVDVPAEVSDFGTDVLESFEDQTVRAGPQHMNGSQALGYSRVRVDGDLKRIERQQLVIQSVADKSVSLGLLAKVPELWAAYRHAFRTDIDSALVPGFALLARQMDLERIESFSLGPAMYGGIAEDGQIILLRNDDKLYDIIDRFLADPRSRDEAPKVLVQYAGGEPSRARAIEEHLAAYGLPPQFFRVEKAAEEATPGIFDLTGKAYTAAKLHDLFDLQLLTPEAEAEGAGANPDGADIIVRVGAETELKTP
jgi:LCP family protein required for cell wall assembly